MKVSFKKKKNKSHPLTPKLAPPDEAADSKREELFAADALTSSSASAMFGDPVLCFFCTLRRASLTKCAAALVVVER